MKQAVIATLILMGLAACDRHVSVPQPGNGGGGVSGAGGPGPISPMNAPVIEGQETHGGDLAVAMLRSALMTAFHDASDRPVVSKLMSMRATSEAMSEEGPLFVERDNLLIVNRNRVLDMQPSDIINEVEGTSDPLGVRGMAIRPSYIGKAMTPELFRETAREVFSTVRECMANAYATSLLIPNLDFSTVEHVPVEYAKRPIYDSVTKRRVDIGVTLEGTPRILIDRKRTADWKVTNYATPYLIFHEYAHLLMEAYGRNDGDHVLATTLFHTCSFLSARFQISTRNLTKD